MKREWIIFAAWCVLPVAVFIAGLAGCISASSSNKPIPTISQALSYPDPNHQALQKLTATNGFVPAVSGSPPPMPGAVVMAARVVPQISQRPAGHTNTNYIQMYVPADGQNQTTNPAMMLVQRTTDFKTWQTIQSVQQGSGSNVVGRILSTNRNEFYRTVSSQTPIQGH